MLSSVSRHALVPLAIFTLALACRPSDEGSGRSGSGAVAGAGAGAVAPPSEAKVFIRGDLVVVAGDAPLYAKPSTDANTLPVPPSERGRAARVIEVVDGFVHAENIDVRAGQFLCPDSQWLGWGAHVEFYVRLDDLVPVLSKSKTVEFADGTSFIAFAGAEVDGVGRATIHFGPAEVPAELTDAEVAWSFSPTSERPDSGSGAVAGETLRFADRSFTADERVFTGPRVADGKLEFTTVCGYATLVQDEALGDADHEAPEREPPPELDCAAPGFIRAGAALTWPSGDPAGEIDIGRPITDPVDVDDRVCFPLTDDVRMCAAASDFDKDARCAGDDYVMTDDGLVRPFDGTAPPTSDEAIWDELTGEDDVPDGSGIGLGDTSVIIGGDSGPRGDHMKVRQAPAKVEGNLDSDIVRRIVRPHVREVRSCYAAGLEKDPELGGRVEIAFVIDGTGKVTSSKVHASDLGDKKDAVAECIAEAANDWKFPKPRAGGEVSVVYPFILTPR